MRTQLKSRKLRIESLEERTLLAVTAGAEETAAAFIAPTAATTWNVNTLDDPASWDAADGILSLREAIGRAEAGDTINFVSSLKDGTITLNGKQLEITKSVTIDAASVGGITIDANGKSRVIYNSGGNETAPTELVSLTICGGNSSDGGGIYNNRGTLTLTNSTVSGNTANYGGGIYNDSGTLTLTNSTVSGNTASSSGGGIYSDYGTLTLTNSTVSGNTASSGGGIYSDYGTLTLANSTVSGNTAYDGGGIVFSGTLTLTNSTVSGNTASSSYSSGGGIYSDYGTLTLTNSTVSGNTASYGGGIYNYSGTLTLTNTIVSLNYSKNDTSANIYNSSSETNSISNSIIGLDPGFVAAPVFESGVLVNADSLDLSLRAESIARDTGSNEIEPTESDLAGNRRVVGDNIDIGAYEYQGNEAREARSTVVTTTQDIIDATDNLISLREAVFYAGVGGTVTFDASLAGRTITLNGTQIEIYGDIVIDASSVGGMTIDADEKSRVFYISDISGATSVELAGLTITGGKTTGDGGGIYNYNNRGTLTLTNCTVSGNTASSYGGGIVFSGTLTLTNSTVSGNTAFRSGGIYNNYGTLTLTNCTVSGNTATSSGGGIYNYGTLTLTNCTVSGNTASDYGGGICNNSGTLTLTNSTVSGNTASSGGGIYSDYGTLTLTNSTVSGNTASYGGGIYNYSGTLTLTNTIVSLNYNGNIYYSSSKTNRNSISNSIVGFDPGFVAAPVFESGVLVNADSLDLSLRAESIARDTGSNEIEPTESDLAGNRRVVGDNIDIGAYEYQGNEAREARSTVVTTTQDIIDATDNLISLREAVFYAGAGGTVTFDASLAGQTITLNGTQIEIYGDIVIDAASIGGVTIDADEKSRVFYISDIFGAPSVELAGLTITGGETTGDGGGIYNHGTLTLTNSTVSGNTASSGGGIYNDSGTLTLTNSTVSGNTATSSGGGIYNYGTLTLTNSTVSGNTASDYGGGICNYGTLTLTNSTVSGNTSSSYGGGIYSYGTSYLDNTIIAQNTASRSGNDVYRSSGYLYAHNTLSSFTGWASGSSNNLTYDSSSPLFTDAAGGDYTLAAGSLAINHGNNDYISGYESDLVGNPRIFDGTVDIGAYEYQEEGGGVEFETPSTVVTTNLDVVDFTDNLISLREAIFYAATGDTITFETSLSGQTITLGGNELVIDKTVSIDASSIGGITVDADGKSRVFNVSGGTADVPVELTALTITGGNANVSNSDDGGGICNYGTLTLTNSTVSGNTATRRGGGIFNDYGTLTLTNSTVSGNTASRDGGGIYNHGTLTLTNSTVSGNTSSSYGGGIYSYGTSYLDNTIIAQNTARSFGNDVYRSSGYLYAYNTLSSFTGWASGSSNNLTYDSSLPLFTDAAGGDYTLAENSQAIDKGNNAYVDTETDLAGNPRIVGGIVDLGAYEYRSGGGQTEQLAAPVISTGSRGVYVSYGANRHYIQWGEVAHASGYELAYSANGTDWTGVSVSGTSAVVTGLTYGQDVQYRVRALGTGSYTDSDWSRTKTFNVCPMDINGDGDIAGSDRTIMATSWLAEEGDENYQYYADINGDGEVSNTDRPFIGQNWNKEAGDDDLVYPRALRAADAAFAGYEPGELDVDWDVF